MYFAILLNFWFQLKDYQCGRGNWIPEHNLLLILNGSAWTLVPRQTGALTLRDFLGKRSVLNPQLSVIDNFQKYVSWDLEVWNEKQVYESVLKYQTVCGWFLISSDFSSRKSFQFVFPSKWSLSFSFLFPTMLSTYTSMLLLKLLSMYSSL